MTEADRAKLDAIMAQAEVAYSFEDGCYRARVDPDHAGYAALPVLRCWAETEAEALADLREAIDVALRPGAYARALRRGLAAEDARRGRIA